MIKLYQFPISHFCEKVRWTLDYKNIEYQAINLIPGLHLKITKELGVKSSVPILQDNERIITSSIKIIDYLEQKFPQNQLTPLDKNLKLSALEWELFLDKVVGINTRLSAYHILLKHPKIVKGFFTHKGPWYGALFLFFAFPKMVGKMRHLMRINDETFIQSKQELHLAADRLFAHYQENEFLVGDSFTRADLAAAALFAPIMMPDGYGLDWPADVPEEFQALKAEFAEKLNWLPRIYQTYR